jgi:hypothetical protein
MNTTRLWEIIAACTLQTYFPNVEVDDPVGRMETAVVGVHFFYVIVLMEKARSLREELVQLLLDYPQPDRLRGGPSYIELGGVVGDQGVALRLCALGEVLGFWKVMTPESMGFSGEEAQSLAGKGMVMITGFRPEEVKIS